MSEPSRKCLSAEALCVEVPGRRLVEALTLTVRPGEVLAVLGPNGTGKTMTLMTLAGLRRPAGGRVLLGETDIRTLGRRQIALELALLTQSTDDVFPATVLETVLIGRHPHIGRWRWESRSDRRIAMAALATMDIGELAGRNVLSLSGGERRRLSIAQVLTQSPSIYLLDEATNHLDPPHQLHALRVFRSLADAGAAIVATLHDVNLAERFADRCLLLYGDGRWDLGATQDVLDDRRLAKLFATSFECVSWGGRRLFVATEPQAAGSPERSET